MLATRDALACGGHIQPLWWQSEGHFHQPTSVNAEVWGRQGKGREKEEERHSRAGEDGWNGRQLCHLADIPDLGCCTISGDDRFK